jgi:hypothetical protein
MGLAKVSATAPGILSPARAESCRIGPASRASISAAYSKAWRREAGRGGSSGRNDKLYGNPQSAPSG